MGLLDNIKDAVGMSDEDKASRAEENAKKAQADATSARQKADGTVVASGQSTVDGGTPAASAPTPPAATPPTSKPASTTPAPSTSAAPAAARTYTVKSGDTLSQIGEQFGVSWKKIAEVNNIDNPDRIYPGQVFTIPN